MKSHDFVEELKAVNETFQNDVDADGATLTGLVGYHTFYTHDRGVGHAWETALHEAVDETLEDVYLDEIAVRDVHGDVTPETMAIELREQLEQLVGLRGVFADRLAENFESRLKEHEQSLSEIEVNEEEP